MQCQSRTYVSVKRVVPCLTLETLEAQSTPILQSLKEAVNATCPNGSELKACQTSDRTNCVRC